MYTQVSGERGGKREREREREERKTLRYSQQINLIAIEDRMCGCLRIYFWKSFSRSLVVVVVGDGHCTVDLSLAL